jgi:hypothetical protein
VVWNPVCAVAPVATVPFQAALVMVYWFPFWLRFPLQALVMAVPDGRVKRSVQAWMGAPWLATV